MAKYWVIAPLESIPSEAFKKVWQFDVERGCISIGWRELGDISKSTKEQLTQSVNQTFPGKPANTVALIVNMIWNFFHEIKPGDVVLARKGQKILVGRGKVNGPPRFSPNENVDCDHSFFIDVDWEIPFEEKDLGRVVFSRPTLLEIQEAKFKLIEDEIGPNVSILNNIASSTSEETLELQEFALEKYLEEFIVNNFGRIFNHSLEIYQESEINEGQQFPTDVGIIDILAIDSARNFVVIELKKGRSSDQAIGQLLRYMGYVKQHMCQGDQTVKGIIISQDCDNRLAYAASVVPEVSIKRFQIEFKLID